MKRKVFVFCIGGTGLRVMKSVIMLLAAGFDSKGYDIIPILVDPHQDLKEKSDLDILIDDYIKICGFITGSGANKCEALDGFFKATVKQWQMLDNEQNPTSDSMADQRMFQEYLGLGSMDTSDINHYLIQTLYSTENLKNKLSVGFKGNPNVGIVVLGEMIQGADWFGGFLRHMEKDDRVFIISSIFGGTGASGYPLLEKKIRGCLDKPAVCGAVMGAVTVLPYFSLEDPTVTNSSIDSSNFLTKTKAALSYYQNTVKSDFLYYVGDSSMMKSYKNDETKQEDPAHFIELVAATALFDFLDREKQTTQQYMSRGIREDKEVLDVTSAGDGYKPIVKCMADFRLLHNLMNFIRTESSFPLRKTRKMDERFFEGDESYATLDKFFTYFEKWYNELADNKRGFAPLTNHVDMSNPIKGLSVEANRAYYVLDMVKRSNEAKGINENLKLRNLLDFAYKAIDNHTSKITSKL